jgi:hypothetical protein
MIIGGALIWVVWSFIEQAQRVWIPEVPLWDRMWLYMRAGWYIPLIFGAVGVLSFILLEKKWVRKKSK